MESKITENKNPSDKVITIKQINQLLQHLVKLPYKDSAMVIQTLTTLKDINSTNGNINTINKTINRVTTNTITKDKA